MKKIDEIELNEESGKAAAYYVDKKCQGAPLDHKQLILNSVAHGFFMGVRWHEELMGVNEDGK